MAHQQDNGDDWPHDQRRQPPVPAPHPVEVAEGSYPGAQPPTPAGFLAPGRISMPPIPPPATTGPAATSLAATNPVIPPVPATTPVPVPVALRSVPAPNAASAPSAPRSDGGPGGPDAGRGRRLLVVASAATVVVVAAVVATWVVRGRGGSTEAAPSPNAVQTGALTGPPPSAAETSTSPIRSSVTGPGVTPSTVATGPSAGATAAATSTAAAQPATVRDDFTGTKLAGLWSPYRSTKANGGVWLPGQVRVRNGELQILGQGTDPTGNGNRSGGLCLCDPGGIRLYGAWQVRARFDAGAGYAQTIGLWPQSNDGNQDGHISLAMSTTADKRSSWHAVIAPGGTSVGNSTAGNFAAWHVYAVEWRATFVRISIDGKTVLDSRKAPGLAVPHTPQFLYLQQEIGPDGDIPAANTHTPKTVVMHVDWVRYAA
jgi:hypothetical protein